MAYPSLVIIFALGFATDWCLTRDRMRLREEGLDISYGENDLEMEPPSRQRDKQHR